jgi:hypothetical protein
MVTAIPSPSVVLVTAKVSTGASKSRTQASQQVLGDVVFGVLLPRQRTRVPVMARLRLMVWLVEITLLT